jgi:hypothetical protein
VSHEHRSIRELDAASDLQRRRLEVMTRHVLDALHKTIRLRTTKPIGSLDQVEFSVEAEFTDESVRVIAPLVAATDMLGGLQPKHLAALRALVIDYIGRSGYIEDFTRVIQNDSVTIEELMVLVMQTADHAEMVEAAQP